MSQQEVVASHEYVGMADLLSRADLERVLEPYQKAEQYAAILRYHQGCLEAPDDRSLLRPLLLLKDALGSLVPAARRRRETDDPQPLANNDEPVVEVHQKVSDYGTRVAHSVETLRSTLKEVPKKLHFVWLGGGVGDIQRDYINIWKQVMVEDGHALTLWYDADALLAYETHRVIVQAAKAAAMAAGGATLTDPVKLGDLYIEYLIPLKEQLYTQILRAQARGESADGARIDLLVRGYGQDEATLRALREKHVRSLANLVSPGLSLGDLQQREHLLRVDDIYQREINLRGNFAAASDVVRAEILSIEGGVYSDVDNLPPLAEQLGGVDIKSFGEDARLGVLQLLLNHNPHWMPGRQNIAGRYKDFIASIPAQQRVALEQFAKSRPALRDVFQLPRDRQVRLDGLRAVGVGSTVNNSFLIAHAGSATLKVVIDRFLRHYEVVKATARQALEQRIAHTDYPALDKLATANAVEQFGPLNQLSNEEEIAIRGVIGGAIEYYTDGLYPGSEYTIFLTGPMAMLEGMGDYEKSILTPRTAEELRELAAIRGNDTVNRYTEEELDHSWKESQSNSAQWLIDEKKRWQEGGFAVRYSGDIKALLQRQTIEFDAGWPLIEGRHVLATEILQRLLDHLGEPFLKAMRAGRDAHVTFDKLLPLSFDERRAILAQDASVLPPAVASDSTTQGLSLIEVLERMAAGSLLKEQLSAAQRLLLGQLLGLGSLDNRSFEAAASELDNLVNKVSEKGPAGRYAVIEEQLVKYKAPSFMAGLNSPVEGPLAHAETALALKKDAMERPLSLRQWGTQVARIQQVAKAEFRDQLVERASELLDSFSSGTAKFVPQDLLFDGFGDTIGRRCYPLVLAMAAAMAKGETAVNTLRERFYMSVLAPDDSDSKTFVQAIQALHGVQESEVGSVLARSSLQQVMEWLRTRTTTSTLMLNSGNHAMLVARTWVGERSTYHFYDPNLGVFEFDTPNDMHNSLTAFFQDQGMATFYGAYGDAQQPTFDLIELQGASLAQTQLSAGVRVADVLVQGALKGATPGDVRKRLASHRGESLVQNFRLGKSLMALDGHWWGQQINQASTDLLAKNQLTADFIPLFETLEITAKGDYQLSLIKPEKPGVPEQLVRVSTDDQRFLRIKNYLTDLFEQLTTRRVRPLDPTGVGSVHTLNAGFAIQALMNALRGHEGQARSLTLAVRLHAYVNYAQLIHGLVIDFVGVVSLVRQGLAQERLIAQTSSTVVGEVLGHAVGEGVGTVLGLVNVGFDVYQLSQATNDVQVARFGTQLAFDSASAVLGVAGMGAGLASAATAAALLGGASVIVGGLAVGVGALAEGFAQVAERSKEVGVFFHELDQAYRGAAFTWNTRQNVWQAHPKLVIQSVDLRSGVVTYDSQRLFPLRDHFGVPDFDVDYDRAINLRQSLGLPGSARFSPAVGEVIVLPCTPQVFYGYDYHSLPFASSRHDQGFDIARRLEKKNAQGQWQFLFTFYSFPGEYILQGIHPAYRPNTPTVIQVKLDDVPRTLVVPTLLKNWRGKVAYEIEAGNAPGMLMLSEGANVVLNSSLPVTLEWTFHAPWAEEGDVEINGFKSLKIGGVSVTYGGRGGFRVTLQLAGNNRFQVNHQQQVLVRLEADAAPGTDARTLQTHFKALAREHRLELPYTPVHRFLIPFDDPEDKRYTTAWYDAAEERFLYIQDDAVVVPEDALLGAVLDGSAYFYHPQGVEVFRTDAVSGLIRQRYRLMLKAGASAITHCAAIPGGGVKVVQVFSDQGLSLEYLLTDEGVFLTSLIQGVEPTWEEVLGQAPTLVDWKPLLGDSVDWPAVRPSGRFETSTWQLAAVVSLHWKPEPGWSDMSWVRSSDGLIIRPIPRRHHARGWSDSARDMHQNNLLAPAGTDGDVFVIYTRGNPRLCVQQRAIVDEQVELSIYWYTLEGLKNVVATEEGCLAVTEKGLFYEVTAEGELQLAGLTEAWFKDRAQWWTQLPTVTADAPLTTLALLGLSNANGDARLCAWYVDGRLVVADLGQGKSVRLLGATPDNAAVWLFDVSSGELYRQPFIDDRQLPSAFGDGARLLAPQALPTPQPLWSPWTFIDVTRHGPGLRATTVDGIQMDLNHQEPALITGVDHLWVREHLDALGEHLQALVATAQRYAPLLRVAHPVRQQWFASHSGRLIDAGNVARPESSIAVGAQQRSNVLLFDATDGFLRRYPKAQTAGPLAYVQRDVDTLTVASVGTLDDVLPLIPDDVSTLILRLGQDGATCRLSQPAWRRLESVIVYGRPPLGSPSPQAARLEWALESPEQLIVSLEGEHLVMFDPVTCHSLIFREAWGKDVTLRSRVVVVIDGYPASALSDLISALLAKPQAAGSALFKDLVTVRQEAPVVG